MLSFEVDITIHKYTYVTSTTSEKFWKKSRSTLTDITHVNTHNVDEFEK